MKTITSLPPQVAQRFNAALLATPMPINDEKQLLNVMHYIEKKLWKKMHSMPSRKSKCEELKKQFYETYERIKTKKENGEAKKNNKTEEFFYMFEGSTRSGTDVFNGLRYETF